MTPAQANEILDNWKYGIQIYPAHIITAALICTGDISSPLDPALDYD